MSAFGDQVTVHLPGSLTGGKYMMATIVTQPGGGPPPHWHTREDEWFLVQSGRVEFFVAGEWKEVPVGTVVYTPRNTVHSFRNPGTEPLQMLLHAAPAGFETFFERCAEAFNQPGGPDMARILEISAEHGIYYA